MATNEKPPILAACHAMQGFKRILAGTELDRIASAAIQAFLQHPAIQNRIDAEAFAAIMEDAKPFDYPAYVEKLKAGTKE